MKHKAQEVLNNLKHCVSICPEHNCCMHNRCKCTHQNVGKESIELLKEHADCQLSKDEINEIMNCLAVACFDIVKYNSIFDKLKKQKEMWEES